MAENTEKEEILKEEILENAEPMMEGALEGEVVDDTSAGKIAALEQQVAEQLDKHQRTLAEFDNFRKRTSREKASMYDDGVRDTVEKLLMVVDNLERAITVQAGKVAEGDSFFKGIEMTLKQFQDVFHGIGVEEIEALGQKFDPNFHAAVAHEEDANYGENEITLEMLKGYKYKDKVLRHSMVKVAN